MIKSIYDSKQYDGSFDLTEITDGDQKTVVTSKGREIIRCYPDLIMSLYKWLAVSKSLMPDPNILPKGFVISNMPWGDQSHPHRLVIQSGHMAGSYVFKESTQSELSQPYTDELLQTLLVQRDLASGLESLGIKLQSFIFATKDLCMVKLAEGDRPGWRQAGQRILQLHNTVFDYIQKQQLNGVALWKNIHVHALDSAMQPHLKDFILDCDGYTLTWVDPFVHASNPGRFNFYKQRIEEGY